MGDVISTAVENFNTIISSSDWSPPSAIYSNFNLSSWSLPSFPAVPTNNQVQASPDLRRRQAVMIFLCRLCSSICCCGTRSACSATGSNPSAPGPSPAPPCRAGGGGGGGGVWDRRASPTTACRTQREPSRVALKDISMSRPSLSARGEDREKIVSLGEF